MRPPPCRAAFGFHGRAKGYSVQPLGQGLRLADGPVVPGQDEKSSLEGVFRVLFVVEHAPAHPQHHRPVAGDQDGKGGLIATVDEIVQELAVRPLSRLACRQRVQMSKERALGCRGHDPKLSDSRLSS
jgi:hypothetical protein